MAIKPPFAPLETQATIISSTYRYARLRDIDLESPGADESRFVNEFSYAVGGKTYEGEFESFEPHRIGGVIRILADPTNPKVNSYTPIPRSIRSRIIRWLAAIAILAMILYLQYHFNWID